MMARAAWMVSVATLLALFATLATGSVGCARDAENSSPRVGTTTEENGDSCTAPGVNYNGGVVLQNAQIVVVFWGPSVNSGLVNAMPGFWRDIVQSPYIDNLSEYSGGGRTIGRGTLYGTYTILPLQVGNI